MQTMAATRTVSWGQGCADKCSVLPAPVLLLTSFADALWCHSILALGLTSSLHDACALSLLFAAEPSPGGGSAGGFPFLAGGSPHHMADAGVQTGTSLELEAAAAAAAAEEPLPDDGGYDGGYEGGADFGGMDDYEQPDAGGLGPRWAAGWCNAAANRRRLFQATLPSSSKGRLGACVKPAAGELGCWPSPTLAQSCRRHQLRHSGMARSGCPATPAPGCATSSSARAWLWVSGGAACRLGWVAGQWRVVHVWTCPTDFPVRNSTNPSRKQCPPTLFRCLPPTPCRPAHRQARNCARRAPQLPAEAGAAEVVAKREEGVWARAQVRGLAAQSAVLLWPLLAANCAGQP